MLISYMTKTFNLTPTGNKKAYDHQVVLIMLIIVSKITCTVTLNIVISLFNSWSGNLPDKIGYFDSVNDMVTDQIFFAYFDVVGLTAGREMESVQ